MTETEIVVSDENDEPEAPTVVVVPGEGESVTEGQIERAERLAVLENRHDEHVADYDRHVPRDEIEWMIAAGVDRKAQEFADLAAEAVDEIVDEIIDEIVDEIVDEPPAEDVIIEDLPVPDVDDEPAADEGGTRGGRIRRALDRAW